MENVKTNEGNTTPESSSKPSVASEHKDQSNSEVPKDRDTKGEVKPRNEAPVMDNSELVQKKDTSSSISPKQVRIPSTDKTAANPKIKVSSGNSPEQKTSVPSSNSVNSTNSQESVAAYPQIKIKQDTPQVKINQDTSPAPQLKKSVSQIPQKSYNEVSQAFHLHRKSFDDASRASAAAAIDTTARNVSVKDAVSKFGGITNWKAHKVRALERQKTIEDELHKVHEEIPVLKKQSETAEESKNQTLKELDSTKRLIEEFKLNLERAQTQEHQAKQDSELAKLRVEEVEQGIAHEASVAAKAQLEVAKARNLAAVSDLETLKKDLERQRKKYASLMDDRQTAVKKAEEAVSASKEVEKTVENLTVELMSTKESLESAHAAHLQAEEHRTGTAKAKEQDILNQEKELKQAEEEIEKLNQKILLAKDLKSKLNTESGLLQDSKAELAVYMEIKLKSEKGEIAKGNPEGQDNNTDSDLHAAIFSAKKNLEEVRLNTEKASNEVNLLKETATSLKSHLESEKSALETIRKREEMASATVASLEAEVERTKEEISLVQVKEREAREEMVELPKQLQKAAEEADQAKSLAKVADEELEKAKEENNQSKARISTTEGRVLAAKKEIEAARAAERLALETINALQEKAAQSPSDEDLPDGITLSLTEYYELSKQAHNAEVQANERVTESLSNIEAAKESELRSLSKLEIVTSELATKKEALEIARQKAEKANEGKLSVEQDLRKWRGEHEQQRKTSESGNENNSPRATEPAAEIDTSPAKKKKKKSIFPRFFMFMGKKKSHSHSKGP